jgi:hypothetical protein
MSSLSSNNVGCFIEMKNESTQTELELLNPVHAGKRTRLHSYDWEKISSENANNMQALPESDPAFEKGGGK